MVQQDGPVHAAEQVVSGDQRVQMEREPQQHAPVPEPSAQPSSSSCEEVMQVSTTPRRARNPDDENEMRTVRPRLHMSAMIIELCERDVPEIDWEKLVVDNSSVYDMYTGLKLDEEQVRAGRETEVKRMLEFEVYEEVNEQQAHGKRIWNSAWLDSQKRPGLVRSRLVVNQVRGASKREDVFAATPPLAAMRFILSRAASRGHGRCLGLWDVPVAFFHATSEEEVFVRLPKNMRKDTTIWRLLKAMYGTQVASSRWQRLVRETLCDGHWKVLTCVPCVTHNETEDSLVMFHGDDFLAEGHDSSLDKLDEVLEAFEIKRLPRIGPTAGREGVFLHRRIRWNESGFSYRPDPTHVDALITILSLEDARLVATPFTRDTGKGQANTLSKLSETEQAIYMSGSGLLQYIALDRTDVVFATKEVRSRTTEADVLALLLLKRAARYLVGRRELTISYPYQSNPSQIDCYTDADWAGDVTTRLSMTAGALMHGAHWLEGWSVTRKVRALSSGESEFYAQGSGAARGLLMKHICHEAGEATKKLVLHCDSVASRGMAQRLGAGKCRHIEVKWLWFQQAMDEKKLATKHVSTESNVADIGTGLLERSVLCSSQGRQTRGRRILTVKRAHPRGDEKQKNLSVR